MTDDIATTPPPSGHEVIRAFVRTLPAAPGVYRMLDAEGEVMYVGKARNLKARVTNYTRPEALEVRLQRMIASTVTMEFVRTETESEALLLEANMIKRLKPRFNVLLRDDKSFPYILIATDHEAPELTKHRGTRRRKGHYFGPFASATAVGRTIASLQKPSSCAIARTASTPPAPARACNSRSSAAPPPAPAKSALKVMASWSKTPANSSPASPAPCAITCRPT